MRAVSLIVSLAAIVVLLGAGMGCGGAEGEQSTIVAKIGSHEIKRAAVERWRRFESEVREQGGLRARTDLEIETAALEALLRSQWIRNEASSRGVSIGVREQRSAIADLEGRIGLFPWTIRKARLSARLGDRTFEARAIAGALEKELAEDQSAAAPSSAALRRFYRVRGWELGEPEQRTFNFLLTDSEEDAVEGERALESGEDWEEVANRYAHPQALSEYGWQLDEATRSDIRELLNPELADVAFDVPAYEVHGPRSLEGGWIVFEVVEVRPPFRPSFRLARHAIRNRLLQRRQDLALASLRRMMRRKYAAKTRCASDFEIEWCQPLR